MRGEDGSAEGRTGLEQARAHGNVLHVEHYSHLGRCAPFEITEDEHLALPHGKRRRDRGNDLHGALAVDARAWIRHVDLVGNGQEVAARAATRAQGNASYDAIEPALE